MQNFSAAACFSAKRPYLCNVFFIVLDLRLTRLGYSGIPFFVSGGQVYRPAVWHKAVDRNKITGGCCRGDSLL